MSAAVALVAVALAGCSSGGFVPASGEGTAGATAPMPEFAGPHAAEFIEAWQETDSDFVRAVLADEVISDQEWAEVTTRIDACFARNGVEFLGFEPEGGYGVGPSGHDGDEMQEIFAGCELESGEVPISRIRNSVLTNPEGLDFDELIVECLVDREVVPPGYTVDDFRRDEPSPESVPYLDPVGGREAYRECYNDPLDLLEDAE
ncbi:hypothetical protein [Homoserinibacter sp. GY 40078]|uniref:hypothetical protein n=1 Tax=Homoserinibacter sp. GY 40078 TaxID=2603275 RepID=UPI0011CB063E|nr:hypothetical protein [Homoserinibacter sp. GY 40078]TXK18986.1 hypothetical protein FVQ89_03375 [Homoserinibacter sp. GY 40078]